MKSHKDTDPTTLWSPLAEHWSLDPHHTYLNHGSFGGAPIAVQEEQRRWLRQMESRPYQFYVYDFERHIDTARASLADFLGADAKDIVFVNNATAGVNSVLRSLSFAPGDELLVTNHEYNASRNALNFVAQRDGAEVVVVDVPYPVQSPSEIVDAIMEKVTTRTRLALLDHVTSQTALILPLETIIPKLHERGIETLIDGAHAPGMLPLQLNDLQPTYYTGNCHKWLCTPRGAAFLYVARAQQHTIKPLAISHGANSTRTDRSAFQLQFDWTGTDDLTAYLCVPKAIEYVGSLVPGGWEEVRRRNHQLASQARRHIANELDIQVPCPDELFGSIATLPLPDGALYPNTAPVEPLQQQLHDQYDIEVPVIPWPSSPKRLLRISAHLYNDMPQYLYLTEAIKQLL
ncbi:MAG TPA: aminotransferase [Myxococcales bacterium]|nr:aminotransferase [Myxococcales bacterium]